MVLAIFIVHEPDNFILTIIGREFSHGYYLHAILLLAGAALKPVPAILEGIDILDYNFIYTPTTA
jgi:hypothetical protein